MRRHTKIIIVGITVCAIAFFTTSRAVSESGKKKKDELFKQVALFSDALALIDSDYVTDVSPKDLIYGALKGMLSALDPYSQFMDPDTYSELKVETQGRFGGIGIELTVKDGLLTVITPIEDTPAWKAGIKSNDRIVKINDELMRDVLLTDAVKKLRGRPGEPVNLTILRESEKKILEFKLIRDVIKIQEIKEARILEDGIGYIRLLEFRENTLHEINQALEQLTKKGMTALILDLRNNPGGLLETAVTVADKFIPNGKKIVYTKGRNKKSQDLEFISRLPHPIVNLPMVVLINEGSASGSEIVAACLKDYKRAVIVGTKSFGKGSVQTVVPLGDGSALRLTTSKYFSPLGKEIHGKGVMPDIVVEAGKIDTAPLKQAPGQDTEEVFNQLEKKEDKGKVPDLFSYKLDNQLMQSVDILKAIKIYHKLNNEAGAHAGG